MINSLVMDIRIPQYVWQEIEMSSVRQPGKITIIIVMKISPLMVATCRQAGNHVGHKYTNYPRYLYHTYLGHLSPLLLVLFLPLHCTFH